MLQPQTMHAWTVQSVIAAPTSGDGCWDPWLYLLDLLFQITIVFWAYRLGSSVPFTFLVLLILNSSGRANFTTLLQPPSHKVSQGLTDSGVLGT